MSSISTQNWGEVITPSEVLYDFDGPAIFVVNFGPLSTLWLQTDIDHDCAMYLVCTIEMCLLAALRDNSISVRGAVLHSQQHYEIELDNQMRPKKVIQVNAEDLAESSLPRPGFALAPTSASVPDVVEPTNSLLSVYLRGDGLTSETMRYGRFRQLTERVGDMLRAALTPVALIGSRTSTYDFSVREPVFGSLYFSVKDIYLKEDNIRRYPDFKQLGDDKIWSVIQRQTIENRNRFMERFANLQDTLVREDYSGVVQSEYATYDIARRLLRTRGGKFGSVTIGNRNSGQVGQVSIESDQLEAVSTYVAKRASLPKSDEGRIIQINMPRNTVLIHSLRGKEVTCEFDGNLFSDLMNTEGFNFGSLVTFVGNLTIRQRRDLLVVHSITSVQPPQSIQ